MGEICTKHDPHNVITRKVMMCRACVQDEIRSMYDYTKIVGARLASALEALRMAPECWLEEHYSAKCDEKAGIHGPACTRWREARARCLQWT